jgi:FkbM family methyltransferase
MVEKHAMRQVRDRLRGTIFYPPLKALSAQRNQLRRSWREWQRWWWRVRWYRRMRHFYAQFLQPGDLAFDIGANVGTRTRVFLQLGARVVSVEPLKECARELYLSFYSNPNFHLVTKALGAGEGRAETFVHESHFLSSFSKSMLDALGNRYDGIKTVPNLRVDAWTETRKVGVTTFDALIARYGMPSFAKIDVDGFEAEVMHGLSQPLPALSFEFVPAYLEPALQSIDYLRRFGSMRLNYAIWEDFKWMLEEWVTPEEMIAILKRHEPEIDVTNGDVYVRFMDLQTGGKRGMKL